VGQDRAKVTIVTVLLTHAQYQRQNVTLNDLLSEICSNETAASTLLYVFYTVMYSRSGAEY